MRAQQCRRGCGHHIVLARKAESSTGAWAVLNADPVVPNEVQDAHRIRVVDNGLAYRLGHIRESLEMRSVVQPDVGTPEDFPWHTVHRCGGDT